MRRRTSPTLDEAALAAAKAARSDVSLIEEWERGLPDEDRAVLAAFAEADRRADGSAG